MTTSTFNPKGKTFKQRLKAFLDDAKATYKVSIGQDSGRTVAWQVKHHVAHMFLHNRYKSTKPKKSDKKTRTISWAHFSDPNVTWSTIKQSDFLKTKKNLMPVKAGKAWKAGSEPDEDATIKHVKSLQVKAGIGDGGKAMVSAGLKPCGEPCKCGAGRSKHLSDRAADLKSSGLNQLTKALAKAKAGSLDDYLKKYGLHRPLLNHKKGPEPWHIETLP
jgi:hypothetical protein